MHFTLVSVFTKNYSAVSEKCLAFDKKLKNKKKRENDIQYITQYIKLVFVITPNKIHIYPAWD